MKNRNQREIFNVEELEERLELRVWATDPPHDDSDPDKPDSA